MDIFSDIDFESPILHLKIEAQAEDIFGVAPSFIKNLWIVKKYMESGGAIIAPKNLRQKQYEFIKGTMEVSISSLGEFSVVKELRYTESFLDNFDEDLAKFAQGAVEKLENVLDKGLSREAFEDLYNSVFNTGS